MAQALGFLFFGSASSISIAGIALTTAAGTLTLAGSLFNLGAGLLLTAATAKRPPQVDPANVRLTSTADAGPRIAHVGRVMAGGQVVFHRARNGRSMRVICLGHGEIDAVEDFYLDDKRVSVREDGNVVNGQYTFIGGSGDPVFCVTIRTRTGEVPSPNYGGLISGLFPEWTEDHRLDGQWTAAIRARAPAPEKFQRMYPNGEPRLAVVARTAKFSDPRTGLVAYTENAALIIAGYCAHPDGLNRPDLIDVDQVIEQADICDQVQTLAAGGSESRWRLAGSYTLTEAPQDVLARMLAACAGRMKLRPSGQVGLRVGAWRAPVMSITFPMIRRVDMQFGADRLDRFNILPARYVDPAARFTEVDALEWRDEARIAADGEELVGPALQLLMSPSHRQTRAVQKIATARENGRTISLDCMPSALAAVFEDEVTLDAPELGLSGEFEVVSYALQFAAGGILSGVTLQLKSIEAAAFDLSVAEEGASLEPVPEDEPDGIPAPTGVIAIGQGVRSAQNVWTAGVAVAWDAAPDEALQPVVRFRRSGTSNWLAFETTEETEQVLITPLVDGLTYDVAVAFRSQSDTSEEVIVSDVVARAVQSVPAAPTGLTVTDLGGGLARVSVTASASDSTWKTEILRDGVVVHTAYSGPSAVIVWDDACGAGAFDWTARAVNVSATVSALTAVVTVTIT